MKKQERIYIAENIRTGEKLEGSANELCKIIGCVAGTIRKYGSISDLYQKTWKIEKRDKDEVVDNCNSLTEEDLQMWDDFIKTIKKKPSKKGRFRKPQSIS